MNSRFQSGTEWLECFALVALMAILASTTGCIHYRSKPLAPAQSAAQLEARRLDDADLKTFLQQNSRRPPDDWPLKNWDLDSLTLAAFYFQPDLAVARAQWREAAAGIQTAAARPNPTVTFGPGYDFSAVAGVEPWMPFGSLDVPIETAGKQGKRVAQAEQLAESARLNFIATAWQTHANVRAALVDFIVARERVAHTGAQFSAQQEISRRQGQRLAAGAVSRADVTASRVALARTQLDLTDAQAKQAEARAWLAGAIGVPAPALDGVKLAFDLEADAPPDLTGADAHAVALCGRADVRAALADYAAAEAALRLEVARQYPNLHLSPGYVFDQGEHKWTLGFTFDLPVLNQNQGPIREAQARRETAAARFTALQARIIGEIDRAVGELDAARGQMDPSVKLLTDAQKQRESTRAQLQAGAADQMDLLNAQIEFAAAARARLDVQAKWQAAIGALENALQRPADAVADAIAALEKSQTKEANR